MLGEIPMDDLVFRVGKADRGGNEAMGLVRCCLGQNAVDDLALGERLQPDFKRDNLAPGRDDGAHPHKIEVGDLRIPQSHLKACQLFLVAAHSFVRNNLLGQTSLTDKNFNSF
jgi:hypothetical protein